MKKIVFLITTLIIVSCTLQAQQRDRRVDLNVRCGDHVGISSTGSIWKVTRCGEVCNADSIETSWHLHSAKAEGAFNNEPTMDRVAPFGNHTAVAAGFLPDEDVKSYNFVMRTTDGGRTWDTVQFGRGMHWIDGFCYHPDGRLWMGSNNGILTFSADSGRTFTVLRDSAFETKQGIDDIYMVTADSGWIAGHGNRIYSTHDNWRTWHRWPTPLDQRLYEVTNPHDQYWVTRVRPWKGYLLAIEAGMRFITPLGDSLHWQPTWQPLYDFEVDTVSGNLWAINDSCQLIYIEDLEHQRIVREGLSYGNRICGILDGCVYLNTPSGVVRIAPDGQADTCGLFTAEMTLEESFKEAEKDSWYDVHPTISHGGRLWRTDGKSIYLQDVLGWYRIAKPLGVAKILPDPDRSDHIIFLRSDEKTYALDTVGHIDPYIYHNPLESFVKSGLQSVEIMTYVGGCFHYEEESILYTRYGGQLRESKNTIEKGRHSRRFFPVDSLEHTLSRLGDTYSHFPSPADFGMEEGEVDLEKVFDHYGGCTSSSGYRITFVNRAGDTLTVRGRSSIDCGDYFPWLLPMNISWRNAAFVTYQPSLWQTMRPMLPNSMMLYDKLNNNALFDLRPGDLLFYRDEGGMNDAVRESTGEYTHVALVESVGDTVWIIDATQKYGVSRRPLLRTRNGEKPYPDVYRIENGCYSLDSVLARARSFIGQPYDNAFQPDNGAIYCSELIYEVFLDDCSDKGRHLFVAKPMNWRDKDGNLPEFWKKHFEELGMKVPEGVPGTNPTDMSQSSRLRKL